MPPSPPIPPRDLPDDVSDAIEELSPDLLRELANYADSLAEHRERERRLAAADDESIEGEQDRPDDVPAKATLTVKEINDNRYYYWQWREGDKVKSKYHAPVNGGS